MCVSHSVVSNSFVNLWTIWLTRLLYPWDSPGRKTGVGFHALLQRILLVDKCSSLCLLQWENSIAWGLFYVNFLSTLADWAPGTLRRNQFYKKFWLECSCFFFFFNELPRWPSDKESARQCWRCSSIPGSGRSPGKENGNPCQHSCLK